MELKSKNYSLCVIIPMYNEENGAARCIDAVMSQIRTLHMPAKLLVINDGSEDRTEDILKQNQKKYGKFIDVISCKKNKGYGNTLQVGIQEGLRQKFTYCLFMDSDLTNDPKYIHLFAKKIPRGYDCVKASRYIKGGGMSGVPIKRQIISILGSIVARNLFRIGIKDCTNGFRMVRLSLLQDIHLRENTFSIILEELYYLKKKHAIFTEIPTVLTARTESKSHFHYKPKLLYAYLKYALKAFLLEMRTSHV